MDYPGIEGKVFEIVMDAEWSTRDILLSSDEVIVLSSKKIDNGYKTRVEYFDVFRHKEFTIKYSQYLWGL